ncbi:MAG: hypothetical protein ABEK36_04870 [Candidatus Aenigmatarchaeota archaeon]
MKVDVQDQKKNPFLDRVRIDGIIEHSGGSTPSGEELIGFLSKKLKEDEGDITIKHIYTRKGMNISDFSAFVSGTDNVKITKKKATKKKSEETEKKEDKEEESEGKDEELEELLDGTISEAKKKINSMETPDYEKILEIEKENKDRKGMKSFLEGKLEG